MSGRIISMIYQCQIVSKHTSTLGSTIQNSLKRRLKMIQHYTARNSTTVWKKRMILEMSTTFHLLRMRTPTFPRQ